MLNILNELRSLIPSGRSAESLKITGFTEIEVRGADGTIKYKRKKKCNTVAAALKYALIHHLAAGAQNYGIDDLFTVSAGQGGASDGKDGIVVSNGTTGYSMITTLSSGGAGSTNTVVFKGVYTAAGAYTATTAYLLRVLAWASAAAPSAYFASQTFSKVLALGDQLTIYWTITLN